MPTFTFSSDNPLKTVLRNEQGHKVYIIESNAQNLETSIYRSHAPSEYQPLSEIPGAEVAATASRTTPSPQQHPPSLTPGRPPPEPRIRSPPPAYSSVTSPSPPSQTLASRVYSHTPSLSLSTERSRTLVAKIRWHLWGESRICSKITHGFGQEPPVGLLGILSKGNERGTHVGREENQAGEDGMMTVDMKTLMDVMGWFRSS